MCSLSIECVLMCSTPYTYAYTHNCSIRVHIRNIGIHMRHMRIHIRNIDIHMRHMLIHIRNIDIHMRHIRIHIRTHGGEESAELLAHLFYYTP